jgi:spermidine synthase
MNELTKLANYHHSDKGTTADSQHGFTEIYEQFFSNIRNEQINILEIGIFHGASLRTYYDYFPNAKIHAVDIYDKSQYQNDRIVVHQFDQSNPQHLFDFADNCETKFDVIIDDGSHHMKDQQITLYYLSKILKDGGIYILEDIHTSLGENGFPLYGKKLEINVNGSNTTLNYLSTKPLKSFYLSDEQNKELQEQFEQIYIFERENELTPAAFGGKSITSVLIKKTKA